MEQTSIQYKSLHTHRRVNVRIKQKYWKWRQSEKKKTMQIYLRTKLLSHQLHLNHEVLAEENPGVSFWMSSWTNLRQSAVIFVTWASHADIPIIPLLLLIIRLVETCTAVSRLAVNKLVTTIKATSCVSWVKTLLLTFDIIINCSFPHRRLSRLQRQLITAQLTKMQNSRTKKNKLILSQHCRLNRHSASHCTMGELRSAVGIQHRHSSCAVKLGSDLTDPSADCPFPPFTSVGQEPMDSPRAVRGPSDRCAVRSHRTVIIYRC